MKIPIILSDLKEVIYMKNRKPIRIVIVGESRMGMSYITNSINIYYKWKDKVGILNDTKDMFKE